ncbi:MAG: PQQ-dependent sugar dehydrogenase [Chloroflexota bacterium]|nr:PQQ-dependent sugar dehydrogenase [Chloroflexota bacterium]
MTRRQRDLVRLSWLIAGLMLVVLLAACSGPEAGDDELTPTTTTTTSQTAVSGDPTNTTDTDAPATSTTTSLVEIPAVPTVTTAPGEPTPTTSNTPATSETPAPGETAEPQPSPTPGTPFDPNAVSISLEQVGSGFDQPNLITHAGDGSGRIFILEKTGTIRLLDGSTYLDIRDRVLAYALLTQEHELGLVGLAFHPDFETNRQFFIHYTDLNQDHVISRFTEGAEGRADPASETILLTYDQPDINFVGGTLLFGADGYLYIGMGTGTSDDAAQIVSQQLDNLWGKILRIDVNNGDPYGIPADNPFVGVEGARGEIWAYGLRNPWRFAFDRATGDLYIGNPGEFQREWINVQPAGSPSGLNYGWPMFEGGECWEFWTGSCDPTGLQMPVMTYPRGNQNCVIIGGNVYRGVASPLLNGAYFFGDYCSGRIWTLHRDAGGTWQMTEFLDTSMLVGSFGEDEAGEVYVADINGGGIHRIVGTPN